MMVTNNIYKVYISGGMILVLIYMFFITKIGLKIKLLIRSINQSRERIWCQVLLLIKLVSSKLWSMITKNDILLVKVMLMMTI